MTTSQVTLEDMLLARDRRQALQQALIARWPEASVVVLTVVAPGKRKRDRRTAVVASAASAALADAFASSARLWMWRDLPTGTELWIVSLLPAQQCKRLAVAIEEKHPLGRLMDIDVIDRSLVPMSRSALGLPSRRCLMCGDDARVCMRASRHSYTDLLNKISDTVDAYVSEI